MLTPEIKSCVDELFTPKAEKIRNDAGRVYGYMAHKMVAIVVRKHRHAIILWILFSIVYS